MSLFIYFTHLANTHSKCGITLYLKKKTCYAVVILRYCVQNALGLDFPVKLHRFGAQVILILAYQKNEIETFQEDLNRKRLFPYVRKPIDNALV